MEYIDYYKILGVEKTATPDQVKKAFRKLARTMHPDVNPNDTEASKKFQQLNEANEVLGDPEKRKKYDKYGKDWEHAEQFEQQGGRYQQGGSQQYRGGSQDFGGAGNFSSFFEEMFGGNAGAGFGRRTQSFKGQDVSASLSLTLRGAATTHKQTFTINGKQVRITIPAGVENDQKIRLKGYGNPGAGGGPNGDLIINFQITADSDFRRKGNDLYTTTEIGLYTALLGGEVTINTLDSKVKLKVAKSTQPGTLTRLKGKGFPVYKSENNFGDLYVEYKIVLPENLNDKEVKLIEELKSLRS